METKQVKLGDLFQELLRKMNLAIKDETLLNSLNNLTFDAIDGLDLIYPVDKPLELPKIPTVNSHEILQEVNKKEELFDKFWEMYDKKMSTKDAKAKFLKLNMKDIDKIFETLPYYLKSTPDIKYRKMPLTYINQRVWEDEGYMPRIIQKSNVESVFKF